MPNQNTTLELLPIEEDYETRQDRDNKPIFKPDGNYATVVQKFDCPVHSTKEECLEEHQHYLERKARTLYEDYGI